MAKRRVTRRQRVSSGIRKLKSGRKSGKYLQAAKTAAAKFVEAYKERYDVTLKYSMDDVRTLDRELEKNYEENTLTPEEIVSMGYYLGELLRRNVGGEYEFREDPGVLVIKCLDIAAFPILKIQKALRDKRHGSLEAYVFLYAKKVSDKREKNADK